MIIHRSTKVISMTLIRPVMLCVTIAVASVTVGCAATHTHEATGQYVDDSVITTKVKAAIVNEPSLKVSEINVETFKGVVQLSGFVSSADAIPAAERITRQVAGVTSVKNSLIVKK